MFQAILGALLIGLTLSVFGSGGSILTVPVLMYLVGMEPQMAIASSMLVVGGIAFMGSLSFIKRKEISWPHVFLFGIPGMIGTYLGAWLTVLANAKIQLSVLIVLMIIGAYMMWRNKKPTAPEETKKDGTASTTETNNLNVAKVILDGLVVGTITGFVGVGGGFLIVPALVLLGGVSFSLAIGTSLIIIAMKSFVGFYKYFDLMTIQGFSFDWLVIGIMIVGGFTGSLIGNVVNKHLPKATLQKGFAVFLIVMAAFILIKSIL